MINEASVQMHLNDQNKTALLCLQRKSLFTRGRDPELDKSCFNLFTVEVGPKEYKKSACKGEEANKNYE